MPLSKRTRFKVFERDSFKCSYCGRTPPDVVLEVDHIVPICKNGTDDMVNLTTSCFDCNRGKGGIKIGSVVGKVNIKKINKELELQKVEMEKYYSISKKIQDKREEMFKNICNFWYQNISSYLSDNQIASLRLFLVDFNDEEIKKAMLISSSRVRGWDNRFRYMCGILKNWRKK